MTRTGIGPGTLREVLARRGGEGRERFLVTPGEGGRPAEWGRAELRDRALRLGALFASRGLVPGDRVLVSSRDEAAVFVGVLACLERGFSAVVVPPESAPPEIRHFMRLTEPKAALTDRAGVWDTLPEGGMFSLTVAAPRPRGGLLGKLLGSRPGEGDPSEFPAVLSSMEPTEPPGDVDDSGEAYVLFTSGSTGRPKGVPIRREGLLSHARTLAREYGYDVSSRILCTLPLHHTDGLMHGTLTAWLSGAQALRPVRFSLTEAAELLDALYAERATHWITVPTQLHLVERFSTGREDAFSGGDFRFVVSSAAPLEIALWERFETRFGVRVCNLYGLTETVCGGLFCGPSERTYRRGTVGTPVDCEARLEVSDDGAPGASRPGELLLRGPHLAGRYLQAPGEEGEDPYEGGWFRTGDLATQDPEGFWRIVGRKKNLVITGGVNVQPEEVSQVLAALPGVEEAVAFGIEDEAFGEALVACYVSEPAGPGESEILEACTRLLSPPKIPRSLTRVAALPRGASGKVDLARTRELFTRSRSASPCSAGGDTGEAVLAVAAEVFQAPEGRVEARWGPEELPRWDSFGHLAFVVELESRFSVRFSTAEILGIKELSDAQRLVLEKLGR